MSQDSIDCLSKHLIDDQNAWWWCIVTCHPFGHGSNPLITKQLSWFPTMTYDVGHLVPRFTWWGSRRFSFFIRCWQNLMRKKYWGPAGICGTGLWRSLDIITVITFFASLNRAVESERWGSRDLPWLLEKRNIYRWTDLNRSSIGFVLNIFELSSKRELGD